MMFGHHDDNNQPGQDNDDTQAGSVQAVPNIEAAENSQPSEQPAQDGQYGDDAQDPAAAQPDPAIPPESDASSAQDSPEPGQDPAWQHPGTPIDNAKEQISDVISPAGGFPKRPSYQYPNGKPEPDNSDADNDDPANRELNDVKEHALDDLAPLLDKLDLPSEEKFRAIMMILQANDDKTLVKAAYAAAHSIEDEEARARALYTIINEVDYFTHQGNEDTAS